jgi:hypothetical protein
MAGSSWPVAEDGDRQLSARSGQLRRIIRPYLKLEGLYRNSRAIHQLHSDHTLQCG